MSLAGKKALSAGSAAAQLGSQVPGGPLSQLAVTGLAGLGGAAYGLIKGKHEQDQMTKRNRAIASMARKGGFSPGLAEQSLAGIKSATQSGLTTALPQTAGGAVQGAQIGSQLQQQQLKDQAAASQAGLVQRQATEKRRAQLEEEWGEQQEMMAEKEEAAARQAQGASEDLMGTLGSIAGSEATQDWFESMIKPGKEGSRSAGQGPDWQQKLKNAFLNQFSEEDWVAGGYDKMGPAQRDLALKSVLN
tara:strand:+ start:4027 stop:4767 length:741 start_codon:yes stop_codon:yes gene_type:complete